LLAKLFEKLDLQAAIERIIPFQEVSPNSTGPFAKVLRFGLTVIAGGRRFSHTMFLGDSLEIYEAEFSVKRIPKSVTSVTRFFRRINRTKYVVNLWNRSGNTSSGNGCLEFAKQTWERLALRLKILGVLADSAFYQIELVEFIEDKQVPYVIAARLSRPLQNEIAKVTQWKKVDDGISVAEFIFEHKDKKWQKPRRYIVIRQQITAQKPKPAGRQLSFFKEDENLTRYRYGCYLTSHTESPEQVWRTYRLRAGDEGIIKENKEDFALDGFSLDTFFAVEAAMLFRILFYNIINLFRSKCLGDEEKRKTLSTLRMKYLLIPAVLGRDGKDIVLRLGIRTQKVRQKILWIINQLDTLFPKRIAFGPAV